MKIQSKLVFDKHSNELIGFVDLGEEELNVSSGSSDLATHALVFFVRGAASDLKYALGYFLAKDVTSYQIMPLFWKAVSVLELVYNLWVCAAVSDHGLQDKCVASTCVEFNLYCTMLKDFHTSLTIICIICMLKHSPHL